MESEVLARAYQKRFTKVILLLYSTGKGLIRYVCKFSENDYSTAIIIFSCHIRYKNDLLLNGLMIEEGYGSLDFLVYLTI